MSKPKRRIKAEVHSKLLPAELLTNNIDLIRTFLMHIDALIMQADAQLGELQPPIGRIRVEWWACPQTWAQGGKCPGIVRWGKTERGAWQADRLPLAHLASRAKRNGWFRESYDQVKEVLEVISRLMLLRNKLTTVVSRHVMQVEALHGGNMDMLIKTEGQLAVMEDWVKHKASGLAFAKEFPREETPKAE